MKPKGVVAKIKPMGADDNGEFRLPILLYGAAGTGKTTLWATFPAPILAIVCSGGSRPGELKSIDTPENRKRVDKFVLESSDELPEIVDHAARSDRKYRTVVVDHLSGVQDMFLAELLGKPVPAQKSWGLATRDQWGQVGYRMKEHLMAILSLPQNIVLVAHERTFGGNDDDVAAGLPPIIGAGVSPSVANWCNGAVDYICQMTKRQKRTTKTMKISGQEVQREVLIPGKVDYCLRVGPSESHHGKFRIPKENIPEVNGDFITDPSYDKIVEYIRNGTQ